MSGSCASNSRTAGATIAWSSTSSAITSGAVSGAEGIVYLAVLISLPAGFPAGKRRELNQLLGNLVQCKNFAGRLEFGCCFRHPVHHAAGRVLGNRKPSGIAQGAQAHGSIAAHPGEKDTGGSASPVTDHALE